eukprot:CAMPEP_0181250206 /NCGR_PEP_ID=MMETSP1096-20121128/46193_1 /TAXON_ID=156174 ORGANISM="Chrysochromulina ericina, Strain CCMP281" /NCGR_SAMPLE_ID=MMETSP1096 /ASSEMBLY_ACC=CAM_ASM_000453 /LENGTH=126 /DNA_ID=CAMNT_0023347653 /DNA_START=482 /DNA_END=861 /DNA_ORIENTATION=-
MLAASASWDAALRIDLPTALPTATKTALSSESVAMATAGPALILQPVLVRVPEVSASRTSDAVCQLTSSDAMVVVLLTAALARAAVRAVSSLQVAVAPTPFANVKQALPFVRIDVGKLADAPAAYE